MKSRLLIASGTAPLCGRINSPGKVETHNLIDMRLPLGEACFSQEEDTNRLTFSKIPHGTSTVRGEPNDIEADCLGLEMTCAKEQIHVDSYAKMIKRI